MEQMTGPCRVCTNPVTFEIPRKPEFINLMACSMIVIEHPKPVKCGTCGTELCLAIGGAQGLMVATVPMPDQPGSLVQLATPKILKG